MNRRPLPLLLGLLGVLSLPAAASSLRDQRALDPAARVQALSLARDAAKRYLERREPLPLPAKLAPALRRPAGVFVTVTRNGRTRGCWGTVTPRRASLAAEIIAATQGALHRDGRFRPVNPAEWPELAFTVAIVGPLTPLRDAGELRPSRHGLLVTGGRSGGVVLPGEARTARWAITECRRKAGLPAGAPAQMFRFEATVLGPIAARSPG